MMIRMRSIGAVAVALAGGVAIATAQQPIPQPTRRPKPATQSAAASERLVVYKSPTCGCCGAWVEYLRGAGLQVEVNDVTDARLAEIGTAAGVPESAGSCHTAQIGGYAVVGHVPVETIRRMLREKPAIAGISVPGMIAGTPGMGPALPSTHFDVVAIARDGSTSVYEHH